MGAGSDTALLPAEMISANMISWVNCAGKLELKHKSRSLRRCHGDTLKGMKGPRKGYSFSIINIWLHECTATIEADGTDQHSWNLVTSFCLFFASSTPLPVAYIRLSPHSEKWNHMWVGRDFTHDFRYLCKALKKELSWLFIKYWGVLFA